MPARMKTIAAVAERFGLSLVIRFGSTARGRATGESDQDIAVMVERGRQLPAIGRQARLVVAIEEALGGPEVDLLVLNRADPLLLFSVARDGVALFEGRQGAFAEFRSYASRRFDDSERLRARLRPYLDTRLA